jgi:hypothetical protein
MTWTTKTLIDDVVENPVVARPYPVGVWLTGQLGAAWRPGFLRQQVDRCTDPLLVSPR